MSDEAQQAAESELANSAFGTEPLGTFVQHVIDTAKQQPNKPRQEINLFMNEEIKQQPSEAIEIAWGIITNAYGGDWDKASPEWREAAEKWRDKYVAEAEQ